MARNSRGFQLPGIQERQIEMDVAGRYHTKLSRHFRSDVRVGRAVAVDHMRGYGDDTSAIRGLDHGLLERLRIVRIAAIAGCRRLKHR